MAFFHVSKCFFGKVALREVKEFHELHDDLKIIWKTTTGRYPVQKICPLKKRRHCLFVSAWRVLCRFRRRRQRNFSLKSMNGSKYSGRTIHNDDKKFTVRFDGRNRNGSYIVFFPFLRKVSIFDKNLYFSQKFGYLTKIYIFR